MMEAQARDLGDLIRKAREVRGLNQKQLARAIGASSGWVTGIERGLYLTPGPERLALLAEVLNIEPSRIDEITMGSIAKGLPEVATYFRAKYNLTSEEIFKIERYVRRFTERND